MERLTKAFALYKKKRKEKRKSHLINLREVSSYSWWLMETSCLQFVTGLQKNSQVSWKTHCYGYLFLDVLI